MIVRAMSPAGADGLVVPRPDATGAYARALLSEARAALDGRTV